MSGGLGFRTLPSKAKACGGLLANARTTSARREHSTTTTATARVLTSSASGFARGSSLAVASCATNGGTVFAMRHRVKRHNLSRPADQRKALVRSLTTELLRHGRIKTTKPKAKAIIEHVDKVITWAKQASKLEGAGAEHKRNLARSFLYDSELVSNIFDEAAERYEDRPGGYTRITPTASRKGDNAEMVYIELV
ncbi:chloroplast ribosomal protein L17 [Chloropicon primus]|uniref:Chloroplast ribosomal protein L17 n=1 Tax=Chloropicon primus TaxID=1764295 RepID=A0A5B8MGG6_9CHLO|nr:chloroplast ribosomal protein L17 [Chloropicon primus]UPQ97962.1 chloroplast ribosomal protein L17 [Chloropicon primus]|eukprot:QDZ18755.1 chloroplast ribosomal protein L17 [Chloropicon primus]